MYKKHYVRFSIIGDVKQVNKVSFKSILCRYIIIWYYLKLFFYKIIAKKNHQQKYKRLIEDWKNSCGYPIYGHKALQQSLLRGFRDLKIKYNFNKISKETDYLILLWVDKEDFDKIIEYKKKYDIKKVITVPTACKYEYNLSYEFATYDFIDYVLHPSKRLVKNLQNKVDKKFRHKIISWESGVKLIRKKDKLKKACVLHLKRISEEDLNQVKIIEDILNRLQIKYYKLEYGKYDFYDWLDILEQVDFAIFYQNQTETQGLAIAECWANDCPTFIKTVTKDADKSTCAFLNSQNGLFWENIEELTLILNSYINNPQDFLNKFSPYEYIQDNHSDIISVKNLIKIIS